MPRKPNYDREDLINRARDLFWKRGWSGTSLKDLEAELQMKPGSFYAAFGSKDALFELALKTYFEDGSARLKALRDRHGPMGALQAFPKIIVSEEAAPARACMLSKTYLELQAHDHPLAKLADRYLQQMEAQFAELFCQAKADGQIDASHDAKALARKYQSDIMGLRISAERDRQNAAAIAHDIADALSPLKPNDWQA